MKKINAHNSHNKNNVNDKETDPDEVPENNQKPSTGPRISVIGGSNPNDSLPTLTLLTTALGFLITKYVF